MKILFLNGSPRSSASTSETLINALRQRLGDDHEYITCRAIEIDKRVFLEEIKSARMAIIVFPLYVDGLPSHLLRLLYESKDEIKRVNSALLVYAIANNGFYEGKQNDLALCMIHHFCLSAAVKLGQGLGIGAGEMIDAALLGKGPLKSIGFALDALAANILGNISGDNYYVQPDFPKVLYKLAAHFNWRRMAKRNGIRRKGIYRRQ